MHKMTKLILTIVVILILILVVLALIVQIPRYCWVRKRSTLHRLDRTFEERRLCQKRRQDKVVVTLSTIPDRIMLLGPTLASLLSQSYLPDEIALNIPYRSRKGAKYRIPKWLKNLKSVTIHRVDKDEGPGTKLLPTLRREIQTPMTKIIAVDDDNIYRSDTVETLLRVHEKYLRRGEVVAVTSYGVDVNCDGSLPSIPERIRILFISEKETDLLQGFSGFLVTPIMLPKEAYDIYSGPPEAISVDDVWFSGWLHLNGIRIITPGFGLSHFPIVNLGKIRKTTALANGENKDFIPDLKVIKWFRKKKGMRLVSEK